MTESNWANAQREEPPTCPHCGATDKPKAKPTLDVQANGTVFCNACSHLWKPDPPKDAA